MAPIREYNNWNIRDNDKSEQIDPYRHYYLLCEGQNTERYYFEKIIDIRKYLGISSNINITYLEKTGNDRSTSAPKKLIELADSFVSEKGEEFDLEFDKIILVFDLDIYETKQNDFTRVVESARNKGYLIAATNPSFELFLMLHKNNSLNDIIKPNEDDIVKNEWVQLEDGSKKRFINDLFYRIFCFDPKSDEAVGEFAKDLKIAIVQEKSINQDYNKSQGVLTSNIGLTMDNIIQNI